MTEPILLDVRVARRDAATDEIAEIELVPVNGGALPAFEAGAHVDVHIAPGVVRQYSLCNDPTETHRYRLGVLRDPKSRGGSEQLHRDFAVGHVLRISAPRCNFALAKGAKRAVLAAGGIGVTPMLSMAHCLQAQQVPFELHYCTRSAAHTAFRAELQAAAFAPQVHFHHDDGATEQKFDPARELPAPDADTHLYVCGPTGFIDWVTNQAKALGWAAGQVHVEHFKAVVETAGAGFTVVAAKSGVTVEVGEQQTIAQALIAAGVNVPMSCEQGVCGTCLTRVIDGVPDHRDLYLTDEEKAANDQMTPCCSRAKSAKLVLEI